MNPTEFKNIEHFPGSDGTALVLTMERAIRDMAGSIIASAINRRDHSSFGYTKTSIRYAAAKMEGAIGLYMVVTGQSSHTAVSTTATFHEDYTTDRVERAREEVKAL